MKRHILYKLSLKHQNLLRVWVENNESNDLAFDFDMEEMPLPDKSKVSILFSKMPDKDHNIQFFSDQRSFIYDDTIDVPTLELAKKLDINDWHRLGASVDHNEQLFEEIIQVENADTVITKGWTSLLSTLKYPISIWEQGAKSSLIYANDGYFGFHKDANIDTVLLKEIDLEKQLNHMQLTAIDNPPQDESGQKLPFSYKSQYYKLSNLTTNWVLRIDYDLPKFHLGNYFIAGNDKSLVIINKLYDWSLHIQERQKEVFQQIIKDRADIGLMNQYNELISHQELLSQSIQFLGSYKTQTDEDFNIRSVLSSINRRFKNKGLGFNVDVAESVPVFINGSCDLCQNLLEVLLMHLMREWDDSILNLKVEIFEGQNANVKIRFIIGATDGNTVFNTSILSDQRPELEARVRILLIQLMLEKLGAELNVSKQRQQVFLVFDLKMLPIKESITDNTGVKNLGGAQILVVDDHEFNRLVIGKLLQKWKAIPSMAVDGKEAVNMVAKNTFDLVIMDVQMPNMDGITASRIIKKAAEEQGKKIPVIGLTAYVMNNGSSNSNSYFDQCLTKPISGNELYQKISQLLSSGESQVAEEEEKYYRIIDANKIREFAGGDIVFMEQLITIFLKRTPEYIDSLAKAIQDKDYPAIKTMAHKVKPTFTYVGMEKFTDKVGSIEKYADEKDLDTIRSIMNEVWADCQIAFKEFNDLLQKLK